MKKKRCQGRRLRACPTKLFRLRRSPPPRRNPNCRYWINDIRECGLAAPISPPYRTYMKECTVRDFERYGRTSPHVNPKRSAAAENLFPVGMPPPAFRGAVSACAISTALRTQKRRHDKQE